jgi:tetratricopeptide (TPR) repeat protein
VRLRLLPFVALASLFLAAPALAQSGSTERARVAFEEGRVAYEAGNFRVALERFQRAYDLTREPDLLYNVATAADRLREDRIALDAYRAYLAARPSSTDRAQVTGRIAILEEQLRQEEREEAAEETERAQREAEQRALREQLAQRPSSDPGPVPWILTGGGAALVLAGIALVVVAALDEACVEAPAGCVEDPTAPRWEEVEERNDRVPIFQAVGGVLMGVGAAVAIGGAVWGGSAGGSSAEVSVGPGSVHLRGRF